jgi:hypothetical protein
MKLLFYSGIYGIIGNAPEYDIKVKVYTSALERTGTPR